MFPEPFAEYGHLVAEDATVMFGGIMMEEDSGDLKFQVLEIFPLETSASQFCDRVSIHLPEMGVNEQVIGKLKEAVTEFRGNTPLHLCIEFVDGPKVFINADHEYKVHPCAALEHRIEQTIGEGLVYISAKPDPLVNPPRERKWNNKR
jgi:hypothetical protein